MVPASMQVLQSGTDYTFVVTVATQYGDEECLDPVSVIAAPSEGVEVDFADAVHS